MIKGLAELSYETIQNRNITINKLTMTISTNIILLTLSVLAVFTDVFNVRWYLKYPPSLSEFRRDETYIRHGSWKYFIGQ